MSELISILWLLTSLGFWITLIIFIVNKFRKKSSKLTWKYPVGLFILGLIFIIIASATADTDENTEKEPAKKSSSIDKASSASSKAKKASEAKSSSEAAKASSEKAASSASESSSRKASSEAAKASSKAAKASSKAASSASESSRKASSEAAKASSKAAENNPESYSTGITYDQAARNPDEYKGEKMQFTGRVIQVMEDDSETQIRLAVDGNSDNVILVGFDPDILGGKRVLEDDLVTASGKSVGTMSYESTMSGKITIPAMLAKIINNQGKASDDYGY